MATKEVLEWNQLKWNNYQLSLTSAFKHILEEEDFVDVTLSAQGQSLKAHKVSVIRYF